MLNSFPTLLKHLDALISLPSVSSANYALDTSNAPVIEYLAQCFTDLGFATEIIQSTGTSAATAGNTKSPPWAVDPVDWCWQDTPTPCPWMKRCGV